MVLFLGSIIKFYLMDFHGAIADLSKCIMMEPIQYPSAYYFRGRSKFELSQYTGAKSDYSECLSLNPNFKNAYIHRAEVRKLLGDQRGYRADISRAQEL